MKSPKNELNRTNFDVKKQKDQFFKEEVYIPNNTLKKVNDLGRVCNDLFGNQICLAQEEQDPIPFPDATNKENSVASESNSYSMENFEENKASSKLKVTPPKNHPLFTPYKKNARKGKITKDANLPEKKVTEHDLFEKLTKSILTYTIDTIVCESEEQHLDSIYNDLIKNDKNTRKKTGIHCIMTMNQQKFSYKKDIQYFYFEMKILDMEQFAKNIINQNYDIKLYGHEKKLLDLKNFIGNHVYSSFIFSK